MKTSSELYKVVFLGKRICKIKELMHIQDYAINIQFKICFFLISRNLKTLKSSTLENIEGEYIKNLQQQIYFLELESNYLYPLFTYTTCSILSLS